MEVLKEKSLLSNIGVQVVIAMFIGTLVESDDGWQRNNVRSTGCYLHQLDRVMLAHPRARLP